MTKETNKRLSREISILESCYNRLHKLHQSDFANIIFDLKNNLERAVSIYEHPSFSSSDSIANKDIISSLLIFNYSYIMYYVCDDKFNDIVSAIRIDNGFDYKLGRTKLNVNVDVVDKLAEEMVEYIYLKTFEFEESMKGLYEYE